MNYYIREGGKFYLPIPWLIPIRPYFKDHLKFKITFPESSWYGKQKHPGWNKTLMLGKFLHYADYMTMAWRWKDAQAGDTNVFKGKVLRLAAYWHDDWDLFKWNEFPFNFKVSEPMIIGYYRYEKDTIWTVRQDGVTPPVSRARTHSEMIHIDGNWLRSPYFGGKESAQYQHVLKTKIIS